MNASVNEIYSELDRLREENARLKELLHRHGIAYEVASASIVPTQKPTMPQLSLEERVALFRSLFLGREDVFARRWYSPNYRDQRVIPFSQIGRKIYVNRAALDAFLRRHRIGDGLQM